MTGPSIVILVRVPPSTFRPHSTSTTTTTDLHTPSSQSHDILSLHTTLLAVAILHFYHDLSIQTSCADTSLRSKRPRRQSGPRPFHRGRFLFFLLDPVRVRIPSSTGLFELRFSFLPCIIPSMVKLHHHHHRHPRINKLHVAHQHLNRE